jgi:hypothetical protein
MRDVVRVRIRCAIAPISSLSVVLWPRGASLDSLGDLVYGGLRDLVRGLYGD